MINRRQSAQTDLGQLTFTVRTVVPDPSGSLMTPRKDRSQPDSQPAQLSKATDGSSGGDWMNRQPIRFARPLPDRGRSNLSQHVPLFWRSVAVLGHGTERASAPGTINPQKGEDRSRRKARKSPIPVAARPENNGGPYLHFAGFITGSSLHPSPRAGCWLLSLQAPRLWRPSPSRPASRRSQNDPGCDFSFACDRGRPVRGRFEPCTSRTHDSSSHPSGRRNGQRQQAGLSFSLSSPGFPSRPPGARGTFHFCVTNVAKKA